MSLTKFYQFLVLPFCTFCLISCNKETERPEASISYFTINDTTSILPNADLSIKTGCQEYKIRPKSEPDGASIFVAINDNAFSPFQNPILLHDSINKISAYVIHPGYKKSEVVRLNIKFESDVFTGTTAIFPNPATDYLTFRTENSYRGGTKLSLLDLQGRIQYTTETEKIDEIMEIRIDLSSFNEGVYLYTFEYGACEQIGKIIVVR